MGTQIKAINFDLDTNALKEFYPGKDYRQAYKDIKSFMLKNGFEHRQWSGYLSIKPMSMSEVSQITLDLSRKFDWLKDCVNRFDITNVGKSLDFTELIKNADTHNSTDLKINSTILESSEQSEMNVDYLFSDVLSNSDPLDLTGYTSLNR
ncbi:MAG: hypothetical protein IJ571_00170 [Ruminococcus sp.]|nr:hypothetical protein [Ruminococcus sp.]